MFYAQATADSSSPPVAGSGSWLDRLYANAARVGHDNSATGGDSGEVDNTTGGHGLGGSNGFAIITNQGSSPSITGGGSITGRTITSVNPT